MRSVFQRTCWCLLVAFPTTLFAADVENAAMLSGSGTVQINGAVSPTSSTVFAGDKVATAKDSSVTLTSKGRTIVLPENSSVTYRGTQVRLEYGRALIKAQPGTEAQLGNLTISTSQAGSQLEMWTSGNRMVLVAKAGSLNLTDGVHQMTLESGQTLMTDPPQDQSGGGGRGSTGNGVPQVVLKTGIPGWVLILAGFVIVDGILLGLAESGVIFGGSNSGALSPSRP